MSEKAIHRLDALAAAQGGVMATPDRTWDFPSCAACDRFMRAGEAEGFQMWGSANLAGLLLPGDRNYVPPHRRARAVIDEQL